MYLTTWEQRLALAARAWLARAHARRGPYRSRSVAGFRAYAPDTNGKHVWLRDEGLLTGAGGIALALVAATTDAPPTWDRTLLLS
jgi:hypothetical protein